ncbi:M14 family zinc carboxypeptidase [Nocardioides sp. R-C-SC26]|uniref:M14 family zinc carboxypeptidase n=1 Tax=Nocardioides sp. R-C-SC26 TaxID=2870414 RepID=UPI001E31CAE5|nr:M14 family zinc carboxypeptidase [Nocardioides sp. R-C-SC26]
MSSLTHRPRLRRIAASTAALATAFALSTAVTPDASGESRVAPLFAPRLVTVDTPTAGARAMLRSLDLDVTEHAGHDYMEVVLHTPADLAKLATSKLDFDVRIPDLVSRGIRVGQLTQAWAKRVGTSRLPSGRTSYRTLDDYNADMTKLELDHPTLVKRFALDRPTLDGRTVYGVEIGAAVRKANTGQPTFVLMGLHHAREWPSGELAMEYAIDLVKNYGKDERITGLLKRARVIVVPVVNADGFNLSRTDGEFIDLRGLNGIDPTGTVTGSEGTLLTPGRAYMRKNCRIVDGVDTPDGTCSAALATPGGFGAGVDLNRNYGGFWGGPGASEILAEPDYRGPAAFSEPETKNIRDLVRTRQVTMLISNHTFSNLILRPNGVAPTTIGSDGKPVGNAPDEAALKKLGARMAAQNGYANIHGWQLYDTTGTTEDYTYNATGGFGYTFEIGAHEFHPPYQEVVAEYVGAGKYAGKGNREAYLIALEHAVDERYSGTLRGTARPGAVLRLRKTFDTPTWSASFDDFVDTSMRVPASGRFSWLVNPSTRPVVTSRTFTVTKSSPFRSKTFSGAAPLPSTSTDYEFVVPKKAGQLDVALDWPTPDDLDLEVYRLVGDKKVLVGSSGELPTQKEKVTLQEAPAGTYVLRVINYASLTPTITLTAKAFETITKTTKTTRERYTMTCSVGGSVKVRQQVMVARGQVRNLDLRACR